MNASTNDQKRRSRRSNVLMSARLVGDCGTTEVKLRNLSEHGALVEAKTLPTVGTAVRFVKGDLDLEAMIAWAEGNKAGVAFDELLATESVLRHVPKPKPARKLDFRRPSITRHEISQGERRVAEDWIFDGSYSPLSD
jgi:hypothetical protein